jgi:hypothetical protein
MSVFFSPLGLPCGVDWSNLDRSAAPVEAGRIFPRRGCPYKYCFDMPVSAGPMALYWAVHPPSIGIVVPVMLCASGAQSHTANLAMSAGDESQDTDDSDATHAQHEH